MKVIDAMEAEPSSKQSRLLEDKVKTADGNVVCANYATYVGLGLVWRQGAADRALYL